MADVVLSLPTSCFPWGPSGPEIALPGNPSYVDGTDISDALFWLFTRTAFDGTTTTPGIGADPYAALSGSSETNRTIFMMPAGLTGWIEQTLLLGLHTADNRQKEYLPGYNWPKYPAHAFRHAWIKSDPDNRFRFFQEDPTNFSDGITTVTVTTTANSNQAVLQNALTVAQVDRYNQDLLAGGNGASIEVNATGTGQSTYPAVADSTSGSNVLLLSIALGNAAQGFVQSVQSDDGVLFPGGQYGSAVTGINTSTVVIGGTAYVAGRVITVADNATATRNNTHVTFWNPNGSPFQGGAKGDDIAAIAVDRKTLTLTDVALWDRTNVSATIYLPPIRPERNGGVPLMVVDSPGDWLGDERGAWSYDTGVDDLIWEGSNSLDASGITGQREEWIAFVPRRVTGLVLDGPFSTDIVYEGRGFTVGSNVSIRHVWSDGCYMGGQSEDVTFNAKCNGLGRHWIVPQGCIGFRSDRAQAKNTERLGIDCETTSPSARVLDLRVTNAVLAPGTALFHAAPATLNPEPSRDVDGIGTTVGSRLITCPPELFQSDDRGAILEHPNLPEGTYLYRRMGPTIFQVSQAAIDTGTAGGILGGAVLFRDIHLDNISLFSTNGNVPLDCAPPKGKVYFTYLVDTSVNVHRMYDIQFDARHDGQVFTTEDVGTARVFWGQSGLFPGNAGVPTAHTVDTLTFSQTSAASTGPDRTISGTTQAGSKFVTASIKLVNADVKSHIITGPAGVFRDGTFIERLGDTTSAQIELNFPAKISGTFTMTVSGRARGYFAGDDTVRWTGFTFSEIRPMRDVFWNGQGLIAAPGNQPCIMAPLRTDQVTIRRNFLLGQLQQPGNQVTRYMAGAYAGSGVGAPVYGEPPGYDFTIEDNYGPVTSTSGMVDNQRPTPTVSVSLVMTVDTTVGLQPVFTIVCTRSDAQSMDGYGLVLTRDGADIGPAIIDGDTAIFRSEDFTDPLDPGDGPRAFRARWGNSYGGSWDTLGALSNTITIRPESTDPVATTTVLAVSPSSPQVNGIPVTFTATVDPDPAWQNGTVTFKIDGSDVRTVAVAEGGVAEMVSLGFGVGTHSLTAVFNGTAARITSTSNTVSYTLTAPSGDPPVVTTTSGFVAPGDTLTVGDSIALQAYAGTGAVGSNTSDGPYVFRVDGFIVGTFTQPFGGTGLAYVTIDDLPAGSYSFTAEYLGITGLLAGSTSEAVPFTFYAPDLTAPSVVGCDPFDGELDVEPERAITISFDLGVDGPDGGGIYLFTDTEDPVSVPGAVDGQFITDTYDWTFTPNQPLAFDTDYLIVVRDFNSSGNVMTPFLSRFATGSDATSTELIPRGLLVAR